MHRFVLKGTLLRISRLIGLAAFLSLIFSQSGCIAESDSHLSTSARNNRGVDEAPAIVEHSPQNRELPDRDLVVRIVDGDTVILERVGRVRLIGVDTPETVAPGKAEQPFGREASEFTGRLLLGKPVRIEYGRNKRDRYDRALAYVYLLDGTFVNAEIIKHGYGVAYTRFPFKHMGEFVKIEREARENGRGMWASDSHNSPEARSR